MKSYTIHLIRHGICEGNLEGRYIGRTQSPLAQEGIQALLELKRKGIYPEAKKYYASPCVRCVDTLKVLYPTADPEVILELAECDFGDWENKKAEELKNDPKFVAWMNGGQHEAPPNGESSIVFMQRVCAGFEMLVKNMMMTGDESAVLVTHGGVIMTILTAYGLPRAKMTDWMCENGHGYSMRIDPMLWGHGMAAEVYQMLPIIEQGKKREYSVIDIAREAADRAYGQKEDGKTE